MSYTRLKCQEWKRPLEDPDEPCPNGTSIKQGSRDEVCSPEVGHNEDPLHLSKNKINIEETAVA